MPTLAPNRRPSVTETIAVPRLVTLEELVGTRRPFRPALPRLDAETGRRVLNLTVATLILVIASPLMLLIALLVKLTSPGPVIFKQVRVGIDRRHPGSDGGHWRRTVDYGGRLFTMYKFRTMTTASDSRLQVWAQPDDPRVTRIGAFLRTYRLDELPQLVNVLKGDMNIVGPRPEQVRIFADLRDQVDGYAHRQRVLPGITGWAQVNQAYDRCLDDVRNKVRYDLEYIATRSWFNDLKILAFTIPVMLLRRGGW